MKIKTALPPKSKPKVPPAPKDTAWQAKLGGKDGAMMRGGKKR